MCRDFEFNPLFGHPVSPQDWHNAGVKVFHNPTEDFSAPTFQELSACVNFMKGFLQESTQSIYVHCKAGRGRSVAVVVCYLIDTLGISTSQAVDFIQRQRTHINMGTAQKEACRNFEQEMKKMGDFAFVPPLPPLISNNLITPTLVVETTSPKVQQALVTQEQEEPWVGPPVEITRDSLSWVGPPVEITRDSLSGNVT